eukprot:TRINITY_DN6697_c0_g1_i1.p1 TRINITY_DN6697_c0_g1~~TRINITY_DN6697_c0_g1_i1.p1  ORF type:complete len:245 (+),score=46.03 TRINITY_DN6697_c0_g1_i1:3-737(+)
MYKLFGFPKDDPQLLLVLYFTLFGEWRLCCFWIVPFGWDDETLLSVDGRGETIPLNAPFEQVIVSPHHGNQHGGAGSSADWIEDQDLFRRLFEDMARRMEAVADVSGIQPHLEHSPHLPPGQSNPLLQAPLSARGRENPPAPNLPSNTTGGAQDDVLLTNFFQSLLSNDRKKRPSDQRSLQQNVEMQLSHMRRENASSSGLTPRGGSSQDSARDRRENPASGLTPRGTSGREVPKDRSNPRGSS